jgi:hypothetical protein
MIDLIIKYFSDIKHYTIIKNGLKIISGNSGHTIRCSLYDDKTYKHYSNFVLYVSSEKLLECSRKIKILKIKDKINVSK